MLALLESVQLTLASPSAGDIAALLTLSDLVRYSFGLNNTCRLFRLVAHAGPIVPMKADPCLPFLPASHDGGKQHVRKFACLLSS